MLRSFLLANFSSGRGGAGLASALAANGEPLEAFFSSGEPGELNLLFFLSHHQVEWPGL